MPAIMTTDSTGEAWRQTDRLPGAFNDYWDWSPVSGPLVGIALHAGHRVRDELLPYLAASSEDRMCEEDPYTDLWARRCDSWITAHHSRALSGHDPGCHATLFTK